MTDAAYWEQRYRQAEAAFATLKAMTKSEAANFRPWSREYRELAEAIHTMGRDIFYVER